LWYNIYNKEREGNIMSRIKCPNCGSTAQVELVWEDYDSYSTKKIKEYNCGCGCSFEAIFELVNIKVLKDDGDT
jgi:C4-type Zn-finger protein